MLRNRFTQLPFFQKVELYLLVPLLLGLCLYLFNYMLLQNNEQDVIKDQALKTTLKIDRLDEKELIVFLQDQISRYEITLYTINIDNNKIAFQTFGDYVDIVNFLHKIELHFLVESFKIDQKEGNVELDVTLNRKYFFNKKQIEKNFYMSKEQKQGKQNINIKLTAIIEKSVLIDGLWYKQGDMFQGYKIVRVSDDFIQLNNLTSKQEIRVELEDESL